MCNVYLCVALYILVIDNYWKPQDNCHSRQNGTRTMRYLLRVGVQGQILWEHDSEITGDPKGPLCGPTFWSGFEASDP